MPRVYTSTCDWFAELFEESYLRNEWLIYAYNKQFKKRKTTNTGIVSMAYNLQTNYDNKHFYSSVGNFLFVHALNPPSNS